MTTHSHAAPTPLLLVSVGSDHHPFPRLLRWVDTYIAERGPERVRYVCQHGTAPAPRFGQHHPFMAFDHLQALMREATAIVVQGGPYSMLESVESGRIPIAVPRWQRLGEAVDDHQHAFCTLLAERGDAVLVTEEDALHRRLDEVLADPESFATLPAQHLAAREATVRRFASVVAECRPARRWRLLSGSRRRR